MADISVAAASGDVLCISTVSAARSCLLTRLPRRKATDAPVQVPFDADHVRVWDANDPEELLSFEAALSVTKVADFLEAPTLPWLERAFRLGLAAECTVEARAAAGALLATHTEHIRGLMSAVRRALDAGTPLREVLRADKGLHARAIAARLRSGAGGCCEATFDDFESPRVLAGLDGIDSSDVMIDIAELYRVADEGPGLHITVTDQAMGENALAPPELEAALTALRSMGECTWLSLSLGATVDDVYSFADEDDGADEGGEATSGSDGDGGGDDEDDDDMEDEDAAGGEGGENFLLSDNEAPEEGEEAEAAEPEGPGGEDWFGEAASEQFFSEDEKVYEPLQMSDAAQALVDASANALVATLSIRDAPLRLRTLALADYPFSAAQTAALAAALATQTQLQRLALRRCPMRPADEEKVLVAAAGLPELAALELVCVLSHTRQDAAVLHTLLRRFAGLTYLHLQGPFYSTANPAPPATVGATFASFTTLRHLTLVECGFCRSITCMRAMLGALRHMRRLETFICNSKVFRLGPQTGDAWGGPVAAAPTLTRLSLSRQPVSGNMLGMRYLTKLTGLQHLDFTGDGENLEPPPARRLAAALAAMPRLTHLNIGNHYAIAECVRILAPAMGGLSALQELGLETAFEQFDYTDYRAIAATLAQHCTGLTALRVLDVASCGFDEAGGLALAAWLQALPAIEVFTIARCRQTGASAAALCGALAQHASVTYLDLSQQDLHWTDRNRPWRNAWPVASVGLATQGFGTALSGLSRLQALDLSRTGLDTKGMQAMGPSVQSLGELRRLDVSCNTISTQGLKALGAVAVSLPKLRRLDVSEQRKFTREQGWSEGARIVTAAGLKALARELRSHVAPEQISIMARGCKSLSEAEMAAVRAEGGAQLRWDLSAR